MSANANGGGQGLTTLASLRRFGRPRAAVQERCELCDAGLTAEHAHLVEVSIRRLVCACEACSILFDRQGTAKYRRVPRRIQYLADFRLSDEVWEELHLPIDLAFFLHSTPAGRTLALYPSPAGATESLVTLEAWQTLAEANPVLRDFEPDVEALLVNRTKGTRDCYRVGIDACYKLVGLIRARWRGLAGGTQVWDAIGSFFADLKDRSGPRGGPAHA
jgi:hypothetical protein